jgi:dihydroxyacetone kinase-like protein
MEYFYNDHNAGIVMDIIAAIQFNKAYLSDIDGQIGDGDHGINMNKGFTMAGERISASQSFTTAMKILGDTLLLEVGGSMGPIYGTFFRKCAFAVKDVSKINANSFSQMLESALEGVKDIGGAKIGDKTLIDTMEPATVAFKREWDISKEFRKALKVATVAAETGKESTRDMIARIGRAARLGERSLGVLDAGATSCYIILKAMFESVASILK